jgi:hypothetical protein
MSTLHAKKINQEFSLFSNDYKLPKWKVRTCFTDAVLVEKIYFLATAENIASTYDDGQILGSLIGHWHWNDENRFYKKLAPQINLKG